MLLLTPASGATFTVFKFLSHSQLSMYSFLLFVCGCFSRAPFPTSPALLFLGKERALVFVIVEAHVTCAGCPLSLSRGGFLHACDFSRALLKVSLASSRLSRCTAVLICFVGCPSFSQVMWQQHSWCRDNPSPVCPVNLCCLSGKKKKKKECGLFFSSLSGLVVSVALFPPTSQQPPLFVCRIKKLFFKRGVEKCK